jgi:SRSO17 transposase
MNLRSADNSKSRFAAYVEGLVSVIGHADRAGPLRDYCLGLIMPCERKSGSGPVPGVHTVVCGKVPAT